MHVVKKLFKTLLVGAAFTSAMTAGVAARAEDFSDLANSPSARLLKPSPASSDKKFISGLNLGYIYEQYGFDLGPNRVNAAGSDRPKYGVGYNGDNTQTAADLLSGTGGNVTRIFVFEGAQGLTFDGAGKVSGIDETFIRNLEDELGRFRAKGLTTLLVLFKPNDDAAPPGSQYTTAGTPPVIGQPYIADGVNDGTEAGAVQDFYIPGDAQNSMVSNAIQGLAQRLHNDGYDDAIFAYDILNEYNQAADNELFSGQLASDDPGHNNSYYNALALINAASQAIHNGGYPGYVTVSTVNYQDPRLNNVGLDFIDEHIYNNDASVEDLNPSVTIPVLLGEVGIPNGGTSDDGAQAANTAAFVRAAVQKGYAGVIPWYLGAGNSPENYGFVVKDKAGPQSRNVRPVYGLFQDFNGYIGARGDLR